MPALARLPTGALAQRSGGTGPISIGMPLFSFIALARYSFAIFQSSRETSLVFAIRALSAQMRAILTKFS